VASPLEEVGMPSTSQTRRRELARLKARREAERRRAQRRRALRLYGSLSLVVLLLAGLGGWWLSSRPGARPPAQAAPDARVDAPSAPVAVACGGTIPPRKQRQKLTRAPKATAQANQRYDAEFTTSCGRFTVRLDPRAAPITTFNFVFLTQRGFYDSTWFHRIVPGSGGLNVIQGGDPEGSGRGGPGYTISDEFPKGKNPYKKYTVAMANSGQPNSGGSQFFISTADNPKLPPDYTVFGKVVEGQSVVDRIAKVPVDNQTPTEAVWIEKLTVRIT
jgi:cyclophilin family peptidyl-prolyl cis-trans isomerase